MLFHNDEKDHVIIGEAAVNLALGEKEISVSSLIAELSQMAERESGEDRLAQIADARRWLRKYMQPGHRDQAALTDGNGAGRREAHQGRYPPPAGRRR
ncbi:hypothetical protein [Pantoea sp. At-9b]|uniref:hypothetical protein n=1 Tax=Pantoea sp. (strain At-9b) TaxID=592316 RepID=UPI0001B40113|nr:hypothetical protein [Pantoea sp. At-9b]ADU72140.1 hypothetical protein Pat9b_4820 [Pantoea sp. At-9b]